jgi:XTP/dITP diphosphohydrolase
LKTNILLASHNLGKIKELHQLLSSSKLNSKFEIISLSNLEKKIPDVEETGKTFSSNALLKAKSAGKLSGYVTLADDSGLEVESLDNFPGVRSARWSPGSDEDRNTALLEKLRGNKNRNSKFVSVICLYVSNIDRSWEFRGEIKGQIADKPQGEDGFGYDPIFIPQGFSQTFAQLGDKIKNQISHRSLALNKLIKFLSDETNQQLLSTSQ